MGCGHLGARAGWRPVRPIIGGFISERGNNYAVAVTKDWTGEKRGGFPTTRTFLSALNWCAIFSGGLASFVAGWWHQLCKKEWKRTVSVRACYEDPLILKSCAADLKENTARDVFFRQNSVICWQSGEFLLLELYLMELACFLLLCCDFLSCAVWLGSRFT